ncbi:2Fe-2S iron-sulfur cluster-binding protein [Vogesella urethralis]|uniref:2Fe-2S iron-sulfur cluster-binding protein n=1 Tax=Vogesella urethralis TaxID=2592656 RepID=UPI001186BAE4|nr:2Fe-2S iron-sulfur cluster-binding protein [Vogesella urethralis]
MPRAFATLTFTPHVKAAQTRYHSRDANHGFELGPDSGATLGPAEAEFIAARDSCYQATSGSNGWPYVQHRGGPVGFLQVLDAHTLAYADFRGNRQYLSVGNLGGNPRMALILMDYPNRRRLKLWCEARVVDAADDPALMAQLENPAYRARIERAIVLQVNAFDWNCPQHITPRFSAAEHHAELAPLQTELARLRQQLASQQQRPTTLGDGPLPLRVRSVTRLAPRVLGLTLEHADGAALPVAAAGSHLSLPVLLPDGRSGWRPYSLTRIQPQRYQLAIQLAEDGRGGSRYIHQHYAPGLLLHCAPPAGHFRLPAEAAKPVLLIAGGIGITPLMAMARQLCAAGQPPQLYYSGRGSDTLAFIDELTALLGERLHCHDSRHGQRLDLAALLAAQSDDTEVYACGPAGMLDALHAATQQLGWAPGRLHSERFEADANRPAAPFTLQLARSQRSIAVAAGQSVLAALDAHGVHLPRSCESGHCGTCVATVLAGEVDHRDSVLGPQQQQTRMCTCVSRAQHGTLTLDL